MRKGLRRVRLAALAGALWLAAPVPGIAAQAGDPERDGIVATIAQATEERSAADSPAAPAEAPPQPEPRPAIWLLQDADTKIYLFGTFHILPPSFRWRSSAIDGVIRDADELVLEVDEREAMADGAAMVGQMMLGKQAPLAWRLSPDRREALDEMLATTGLPAETFDGMKTWAATLTIAVLQMVRQYSGADGGPADISEMPGVEDQLEGVFAGSGRPISGVETATQQLGFFGAVSFAEERQLLEEMVDAHRSGETSVDISEIDWVRGDVEAIAIGRDVMPAGLYDALITRRNRAWTEWLIQRLERPGTVLFAVGAGHMAGPDSVQTMLAARGFTAGRVD